MILLGLDPGFATLGWSICNWDQGEVFDVVNMSTFTTEKCDKKLKRLATDDNFRRAQEMALCIRGLVTTFRPSVICAESMSFPRNASAAAKVAMTWGILASVSNEFAIPVLQVSPQEVKIAVCDSKSASKEDIQQAIKAMLPSTIKLSKHVSAGKLEHTFDSVAVAVACEKSDMLRFAKIIA